MPATFILLSLYQKKLKLSTLCCHSLIHVGIVGFDGQLPHCPSNKPCNHGGAVRHDSGMDVANQPTPPPGASSEGVGRGWFTRVMLSLTMGPRKNLIYINNRFILV